MSEARHSKIEGVRPPRRLALKQSCASAGIKVLLRRLSHRFVLLESHVPMPCACPRDQDENTILAVGGHAVALRCVLARQALDEACLEKSPGQKESVSVPVEKKEREKGVVLRSGVYAVRESRRK